MHLPVPRLAAALVAELVRAGPRSSLGAGLLGRLTVLALDRVRPDREAYLADVLAYGNADLLTHRAEGPRELVRRQAASWDPLLDRAAEVLGADLKTGVGIRPVDQADTALRSIEAALRARLARTRSFDFALAAIGEMTTLSGSLVLALAVSEGWLPAPDAWSASIIDENWQSERWGVDGEAETALERRRQSFLAAADVLRAICCEDRTPE